MSEKIKKENYKSRSFKNSSNSIFFNHSFDKKRLKALISWVFKKSGEAEALRVLDLLKETGFRHATKAGISIGLHDLTTPIQKSWLISESQLAMNTTNRDFIGAKITATERSQRIIDTWHRASESLSKQVVDYFGIYDQFNPVYIMALSGARGNFSQVRQLIGMRGLMADQQGKIVNFPIRSNLREGLTLTEYFISCSGARKGLVDTALRTADTGYLTRRLVDVSHHVVVKRIQCNTNRGIAFKSLQSYNKILLALKERLVGRVLAEDIEMPFSDWTQQEKEEEKDEEKPLLPFSLFGKAKYRVPPVLVTRYLLCQSSVPYGQGTFSALPSAPVPHCSSAFLGQEGRSKGEKHNKLAKHSQFYFSKTDERSSLTKEGKARQDKAKQSKAKQHQKAASSSKGQSTKLIAKKNQEISPKLSLQIAQVRDKVFIRSPLTCGFTHSVCQLCYGWSISQGSLVSLGDAVGVIAAQSIGEPGTQLTMRTFHTGGVFSGDLLQEIRAPHAGIIKFSKAFQGLLIRTAHGRIAFLSKTQGSLILSNDQNFQISSSAVAQEKFFANTTVKKNAKLCPSPCPYGATPSPGGALGHLGTGACKSLICTGKASPLCFTEIPIQAFTMLFVRQGEKVENNQLLAEFSIQSKEGNQPIKTQQTVFAELSGRVIEDRGGSTYTKSIKESYLSKFSIAKQKKTPKTLSVPLPPASHLRSEASKFCPVGAKPLPLVPCRASAGQPLARTCTGTGAQKHWSAGQVCSSTKYLKALNCPTPTPSAHVLCRANPCPCPFFSPRGTAQGKCFANHRCFAQQNKAQKICKAKNTGNFLSFALLPLAPEGHWGTIFDLHNKTTQNKEFVLLGFSTAKVNKPNGVTQTKTRVKKEYPRENKKQQEKVRTPWGGVPCLVLLAVPYRGKKGRTNLLAKKLRFLALVSKTNKISGFNATRCFTNPRALSFAKQSEAKQRSFASYKKREKKIKREKHDVTGHTSIRTRNNKKNHVQNQVYAKPYMTTDIGKKIYKGGKVYSGNQIGKSQISFSLKNDDLLAVPCPDGFARGAQKICTVSKGKKRHCKISRVPCFATQNKRQEDLENDVFKYIEPVKSGRLGFLKILSTRVGATLDYTCPIKPFDYNFIKRKKMQRFKMCTLSSTFCKVKQLKNAVNYFHPDHIKENRFFLQTIAEYGDIVEEGYKNQII